MTWDTIALSLIVSVVWSIFMYRCGFADGEKSTDPPKGDQ